MNRQSPRLRLRPPAGFTLVEALVSITIAAIAGSVLLLGVNSSLQATGESLQQTIADGLAEQLMDEVLGGRYVAVGEDGYQTSFSASSYESSGSHRERYDDIDDYNGIRRLAPVDAWRIALGKDDGEGGVRHANFQVTNPILEDWRQEVDVYYVDESDLSTPLPFGQTSDYRIVEVRIVRVDPDRGNRQLAILRRVVAYVPPI